MTLNNLEIGQTAVITSVNGEGELRQHFLDMGVIQGTEITLEKLAPMGDPMLLKLRGYELSLRLADGEKIEISEPYSKEEQLKLDRHITVHEHPGLGEGGRYHVKAGENPLPQGTELTFALAGNQNCGKTTLFNQLTGSNQHVGNFPGVTVDRKSGKIKGHPEATVTDLPGIYSLSPYSDEEIVSRRFILDEMPKCLINIVDATNIERNLYLTMQLMELDIPIVLALNMMDEVKGNGGRIDINAMEALLGIPVVPISASKNEGVDELVNHAVHIAQYQERPGRIDFCSEDRDGAVHRCLHGIMHLIQDHSRDAGIPLRFAASKLVEGDGAIIEELKLSQNEKEMIEHIIIQMEDESGLDRAAAIADMRFSFITDLCEKTVIKPHESKEHIRSRRIDRVLTGRFTAVPAFLLIMAAVFFLTFNVIGSGLQHLLERGIGAVTSSVDSTLTSWNVNPVIHSLVVDGIFNGVGTVLSFVPIIVTLFLFLSLLEDSGYMTRVAFVTDKLLRKIGLSGKSIVPMLIGFGCTVPGVMATRTLSSERDRKMTIMMTPFISCSAKLPIYSFLAAIFFPDCAWLVMVCLYFLGIAIGILFALIAKRTVFKGEAVPFVMELPNYRLPAVKNTAQLLWDKIKDFLKRAFSVILIATVLIWFLQTFNFKLNQVDNPSTSMLATIAGLLVPLFIPLGLGDYRILTSLISGFIAKESVVSTLSVLYGSTDAIKSSLSTAQALSLLVFCLLYTPCIAAIAAIRRELGAKWSLIIVAMQCAIAWVFAFIAALIGTLIFGG